MVPADLRHSFGIFIRIAAIIVTGVSFQTGLRAQVENVPVNNQVYEFLDRMAVRGLLPLYSNAMIPLSREEVAGLLQEIDATRLNDAESGFLQKFRKEFMHEIDPRSESADVLIGVERYDPFSQQEKFLYAQQDTSLSLYLELIGSIEHRRAGGDRYGGSDASFENHGFRVRGTVQHRLGYFLQATNGALYGDKEFALSDPKLRSNVKFKDLNSPYFDFTEAYLRADLSWFNLEFGREFLRMGTGYSDRLLLSDNAPVFDFLKLDAKYKSLRFVFVHGSLLSDSATFPGTMVAEPDFSSKYLALHRLQWSLFGLLNVGASEMVIYQRLSPEFAYLNPINFFKSAEHSLRDRDNASLAFDVEMFPAAGYKLYGSWLIDDIDFSKMGTGWWGNQFGWQGGIQMAAVAGIPNFDVGLEYTRIEPYVYSNRIVGNNVTHNNVVVGHHLAPNSDELFVQFQYRPTEKLRTWFTLIRSRHGENITVGDSVLRNVGGNALQGHRPDDPESVSFLDGNLVHEQAYQVRISYEPVTNMMLTASYEIKRRVFVSTDLASTDRFATIRIQIEH